MKKLVVIRGGGDIATGIACRLFQSGFNVIILEIEKPTVIRHTVALAQCLFTGVAEVEGVRAVRVNSAAEAKAELEEGRVPVLVDPEAATLKELNPDIVVDAILAKSNTGTTKDLAPIVIGVGPGFTAGVDVHAVVETQRGHHLGRVYYSGAALPNTGVPGEITGISEERVVRAPAEGCFKPVKTIGEMVQKGEVLGSIGDIAVPAPISGMLRGLINQDVYVTRNMKIGDVDPRRDKDYCHLISDKARAVGGGVLEAILHLHYVKCSHHKSCFY